MTRLTVMTATMTVISILSSQAAARPAGCFERTYSGSHLSSNPKQDIRRLIINIAQSGSEATFSVKAWLKAHPQIWRAGGGCKPAGESWRCLTDTDGDPELLIHPIAKGIRLENPHRLKLFDDQTGPDLNTSDISGPANRVFVLMQTAAKLCAQE